MALPRINEVLKFSLTIPSTGQVVRYRPYVVKEEKVLLQAFESKDTSACLQALSDTLESCLDPNENIKVSSLATFDLEYMFLKVRSKSVGESSDVVIRCKECNEPNEHSIDLEEVNISVNKDDFLVDITDTIKVEMRFPSYERVTTQDIDAGDIDSSLNLVASCISAVHTEDERTDCSTVSSEEMLEFLGSMTATQLKGISDFIENMPSLTHDIFFKCQKCGVDNEITLSGLSDFF